MLAAGIVQVGSIVPHEAMIAAEVGTGTHVKPVVQRCVESTGAPVKRQGAAHGTITTATAAIAPTIHFCLLVYFFMYY